MVGLPQVARFHTTFCEFDKYNGTNMIFVYSYINISDVWFLPNMPGKYSEEL